MKKVQLVQEFVQDIPINDVSFSFEGTNVSFQVLRLDLISSYTSGNKYFKLFYNILDAQESGSEGIITYGGPYSNHLLATAEACNAIGLDSIGFVRGTYYESNYMLDQCKRWGMDIIQIPSKYWNDREWVYEKYNHHFRNRVEVPLGGSNKKGIRGASQIAKYVPEHIDEVYIAVGSGGTLTGLASGYRGKISGVSVAEREMSNIISFSDEHNIKLDNVSLIPGFWFGSFGKVPDALIRFCNEWFVNTGIPLDLNYTAKVAYFMCKQQGVASKNALMIHTGGLRGNEGYKDRFSDDDFLCY